MTELKCGAAKIIITPPNNIGDLFIAGYRAMQAPKINGVHDPIYSRVIVLNDNSKKIALISVDCIGLLADFIERIKVRLEALDYKKRDIFIFSTHTHGAPDTMGLWGPIIGRSGINKKYMNFLIDSIEKAVIDAEKKLEECEIFLLKTSIKELVINYRNENDFNSDLNLVKFISKNNDLIATFWTYSVQPEITSRENITISADYPGIVCEKIEKEFGGIAIFGLGLCGAQNPVCCEEGFEKMEEFANEVFAGIKTIFNDGKKIDLTPIELRERKIKVKLENPDFQLMFKIGIFDRDLKDDYFETMISKIRIGNLHLVFIPGEPFPSLFAKTIERNKDKDIVFISLANDALGYFIPKDQYKLKTKKFLNEEKEYGFIGHERESIGLEASETIRKTVDEIFRYRTVMAIGAHADDLTIWAGGTLAKLSSEGNKLIFVRITDDYGDAVGISKEKAIKRNHKEAEIAYRTVGADEIIHMDYPTDTLAGVDYLKLRGELIYLIRKYKPDLVISFDLNGTDEENMDHIITARAVNEACWQSSVDLFYPEHFEEGLEIHAVGERWLFARNPTIVNHVVDITEFVEDKIKAISQHKTVMKNWFYQHKLLARANNLYIELLEEDVPNPIRVNLLVKIVYGDLGKQYGMKYAEVFNKIDAGFLKDLAED